MARGEMEHVPRTGLEKIPGWLDLTESQKEQFIKQDGAIGQELEQIGRLRASVGNRLLSIRTICKKSRVFMAWLRYRGIPYSNAKNWIAAAVTAKMYLPVNFSNVAFELGLDKIDVPYVLENIPKNSGDPVYVAAYMKGMKASKGKHKQLIADSPDSLVADAYNQAALRLDKMTEITAKQKREEAVKLMGMVAYYSGFQSPISIAPVKPPERKKKGRPRLTIEGKKD